MDGKGGVLMVRIDGSAEQAETLAAKLRKWTGRRKNGRKARSRVADSAGSPDRKTAAEAVERGGKPLQTSLF